MEDITLSLFAIGFVAAWIIGYIAHKKHWKIADFF